MMTIINDDNNNDDDDRVQYSRRCDAPWWRRAAAGWLLLRILSILERGDSPQVRILKELLETVGIFLSRGPVRFPNLYFGSIYNTVGELD